MLQYKHMDFLRDADEIDVVVPRVSAAYRLLRDNHSDGIYTSLGRYYNHTIFGRDCGMSAKFVADFDHETVWNTILTLASYQGVETNRVTQEEPGRIHHEMRDYTTWQGRWYDRAGLWWADRVWGTSNKRLLTYFAADTTATYIRLVNKYATHIDGSIVERIVPRKDGKEVMVGASIEAAANWLSAQVDETGLFRVARTNRWSLPYQTFADSVTAYTWSDGSPADTSGPHSFVEVQAYVIDALQDAALLLPGSEYAHAWHSLTETMHAALFREFWSGQHSAFSPGIFERNGNLMQLDTEMITGAWTLNASFWEKHMDMNQREKLMAVVKRLFKDDFLTDVGIRTRSVLTDEPLGDMIDYHGKRTVWPMFNFMVIEGLRRHGLYRLARQLEYRVLNGINAIGNFPEFMIVEPDGKLYAPDKSASLKRAGQMIPEQNIAFTVVPAITLAQRHLYARHKPASSGWRYDLEQEVLRTIPSVELVSPGAAAQLLSPTPLRILRSAAGVRSALHILPVILKQV